MRMAQVVERERQPDGCTHGREPPAATEVGSAERASERCSEDEIALIGKCAQRGYPVSSSDHNILS